MTQVIRRHWLSTVLTLTVLTGVAVWLLIAGVVHLSAVSGAVPQPLVVDIYAYQRIRDVRERLCLTPLDLGAMSCTAAESRQVLAALVSFDRTNATALIAAQQAELQQRAAVRTLWQKVNVGPQDPAAIGQIPIAERNLTVAVQAHCALMDQAIPQVAVILTTSQNDLWTTARANKALGAPSELRYVPGLSPQQCAGWKKGQRQGAGLQMAALWGAQAIAMKEAAANQQARMPEILANETATLPMPHALAKASVKSADPKTVPTMMAMSNK